MPENIHIKKVNGKTYIRCPVRKKWLVLTPEEQVRQYMIERLTGQYGYPLKYLSAEKTLTLHELKKRYDIVVYDRHLKPVILVECKAPDVILDDKALKQIAIYNLKLQVPSLAVSNGRHTYFFEVSGTEVRQVADLPGYTG